MSHRNPRILASNGAMIEARRKEDHLKWRDLWWIAPSVILPFLFASAHWRRLFELLFGCVVLALLIAMFRRVRRDRRVWPHRYPWTYVLFIASGVVVFAITTAVALLDLFRDFRWI